MRWQMVVHFNGDREHAIKHCTKYNGYVLIRETITRMNPNTGLPRKGSKNPKVYYYLQDSKKRETFESLSDLNKYYGFGEKR